MNSTADPKLVTVGELKNAWNINRNFIISEIRFLNELIYYSIYVITSQLWHYLKSFQDLKMIKNLLLVYWKSLPCSTHCSSKAFPHQRGDFKALSSTAFVRQKQSKIPLKKSWEEF